MQLLVLKVFWQNFPGCGWKHGKFLRKSLDVFLSQFWSLGFIFCRKWIKTIFCWSNSKSILMHLYEHTFARCFDIFPDICRSFSRNFHIWNSRNCLSYIHMLTQHLEWLFKNFRGKYFVYSLKRISSPIAQDMG